MFDNITILNETTFQGTHMHTNTFQIIENTVEYGKTNVLIYKEVDTTAYGIITYKMMREGFISTAHIADVY